MEAIVRGPIPKLADRLKSAPAELERIVARCLAKEPGDRFAAGELQDALDRYLIASGELVPARRIRELLDRLFAGDHERGPVVDTTPFGSSFHFAKEEQELDGEEIAAPPARLVDLERFPTPSLDGSVQPVVAPWNAISSHPPAPKTQTPITPPPREPVRVPWAGVIAMIAIVAVGVSVWYFVWGPGHHSAPIEAAPAPILRGALAMSSTPSGATLFVDEREVGTTPITVSSLATGSHRVRLELEDYEPHRGSVEIRAGETHTIEQPLVRRAPPPEPVGTGRITLTTDRPARVLLGDRDLGTTPLRDVELPAGVVRLDFETADGTRHRRGVLVPANDRTSTHVELTE
jgi:hypothetical protein